MLRSAMLNGMMQVPVSGGAGFVVEAADFDGTNDYMARGAGLTGAADGKKLTLSFWLRIDGGDGAYRAFLASENGKTDLTECSLSNLNQLQAVFLPAVNVTTNAATFTASATWRHFIISFDVTDTNKRHIYIDDVPDAGAWGTYVNSNADLTATNWWIGRKSDGTAKFNGALAEYFLHLDYIDLSVEANRRKFRSADGKPVDLGSDGSTPFGVQPIVYLHLGDGEAVANFAVNVGSGGNFTITGTLETSTTSPSD